MEIRWFKSPIGQEYRLQRLFLRMRPQLVYGNLYLYNSQELLKNLEISREALTRST